MLEYGIMHTRYPDELHRGPMTREAAVEWISEWIIDGGKHDTFYIVSREVQPWKVHSDTKVVVGGVPGPGCIDGPGCADDGHCGSQVCGTWQ